MTRKEKYQLFCKRELELPIFAQPWYLDAACQANQWDVVLIEKGDQVIASMPYAIKKSGPFTVSTMPHLTKFLGPYLTKDFCSTKQAHKIIKSLIEQLPPFAYFNQNCFYTQTDWLPFLWKGFEQTTQYSYVIEDLSNLNKVYQNISSNYRNNKIKKAEAVVQIVKNRTLEEYFEVQQMSFKRQGILLPFSFEYFKKYDEIISAHHARQLLFAVDKQGQIHSAAYLLIDRDRVYYHIAGDNPDLRNSGAGILLAWKAIQFTKQELGLNIFDFEGSMIQSIERVRREFGAKQIPYFNLTRYGSKVYKILRVLRG